MNSYEVNGLAQLKILHPKVMKKLEHRIAQAIAKTAGAGTRIIKQNVPVAFGELRESVHVAKRDNGTSIVVDAPHAAGVEIGTRPHMVPLGPLVAWVKLRAAQGLITPRQQSRLPGSTSGKHATSIASAMKRMSKGGSTDIDAPVAIARAIQLHIAKAGTKPHWYVKKSVPAIENVLRSQVRQSLNQGP